MRNAGIDSEDKVVIGVIVDAVSHGLHALQATRVISFPGAPEEGWSAAEIADRLHPAVDRVIAEIERGAEAALESHLRSR